MRFIPVKHLPHLELSISMFTPINCIAKSLLKLLLFIQITHHCMKVVWVDGVHVLDVALLLIRGVIRFVIESVFVLLRFLGSIFIFFLGVGVSL